MLWCRGNNDVCKQWGVALKKAVLALLTSFLLFALFQYLYVGNQKDLLQKSAFEIIAHRGVHHDFHRENLDDHTCTASRIYKPTHRYIENTIDSIQAAFDYGATIVEIDIRPTKDKKLVVFHDHGLECRTNGKGKVWEHSLNDLRKLDIGYGYTYDGGKTYPFRGKGIGKINTLVEVLNQFPDKRFLIDNKNGKDMDVAQLIVDSLLSLPKEQCRNIYLWTHDETYKYIHRAVPAVTRLLLPRHYQKKFFKSYILSFGLKVVSSEYKNQGLGLPIEYTKYIWGWPYRFLGKIYDAKARFYLFINTEDELNKISEIPLDGIITDRIEVLSKHL
jgi:glycerophosphoryl diester phosphodiesterase